MSDTLTMNDYQARAATFARYPADAQVVYPLLGLIGEVGELADKLRALLPPEADGDPEMASEVDDILMRAAEVGLFAERLKKWVRDSGELGEDGGDWCRRFAATVRSTTPVPGSPVGKELGDVQWYVPKLAGDIGLSLGGLAQANLEKLSDRAARQVIAGSGDDR